MKIEKKFIIELNGGDGEALCTILQEYLINAKDAEEVYTILAENLVENLT